MASATTGGRQAGVRKKSGNSDKPAVFALPTLLETGSISLNGYCSGLLTPRECGRRRDTAGEGLRSLPGVIALLRQRETQSRILNCARIDAQPCVGTYLDERSNVWFVNSAVNRHNSLPLSGAPRSRTIAPFIHMWSGGLHARPPLVSLHCRHRSCVACFR